MNDQFLRVPSDHDFCDRDLFRSSANNQRHAHTLDATPSPAIEMARKFVRAIRCLGIGLLSGTISGTVGAVVWYAIKGKFHVG